MSLALTPNETRTPLSVIAAIIAVSVLASAKRS